MISEKLAITYYLSFITYSEFVSYLYEIRYKGMKTFETKKIIIAIALLEALVLVPILIYTIFY